MTGSGLSLAIKNQVSEIDGKLDTIQLQYECKQNFILTYLNYLILDREPERISGGIWSKDRHLVVPNYLLGKAPGYHEL